MQTIGIPAFESQTGKTLMPAPGEDGHPLQRALETDEENLETSSSSDSEAESLQIVEPPRMFHPPKAPVGFSFVQN